jgi:Uma2 family endonuclease
METATKLMTAEDLLALPDDGMLHEVVNGELSTMAPAGLRHGIVSGLIHAHLCVFVKQGRLGVVPSSDTGYILRRNPATVRAPDVSFIRAERATDERGYFHGAPDLAVEVISPNDRFSEVHAKVRDYLAAGTPVVIVVDPETEFAEIHTASGVRMIAPDGALDAPDVVPGWSLPLAEIFA